MNLNLQDQIDQLKQTNEALVQEFTNTSNQSNPENIKKKLAELIPEAIEQLQFLLSHSDSDSTRFNTAKYVIQLALTGETTDDALQKLLSDLSKTKQVIA